MAKLHFLTKTTFACIVLVAVSTATRADLCPGDCDGNGVVSINELLKGVAMALSSVESSSCAAMDSDQNGAVVVSELIAAVRIALGTGCAPPPTATPTPVPTEFRIDGCVNEFPGEPCGAFFETVLLQPLGITSTLGSDRQFHFEGIPPGDYTLTVVQGCNPFGCWPPVHVSLTDEDIFVDMELVAPTPTPTPNAGGVFRIDGCVNEFPGNPCGAFFETVSIHPPGLSMMLGNDRQFHFENRLFPRIRG